jgi:hypothetical protein
MVDLMSELSALAMEQTTELQKCMEALANFDSDSEDDSGSDDEDDDGSDKYDICVPPRNAAVACSNVAQRTIHPETRLEMGSGSYMDGGRLTTEREKDRSSHESGLEHAEGNHDEADTEASEKKEPSMVAMYDLTERRNKDQTSNQGIEAAVSKNGALVLGTRLTLK